MCAYAYALFVPVREDGYDQRVTSFDSWARNIFPPFYMFLMPSAHQLARLSHRLIVGWRREDSC